VKARHHEDQINASPRLARIELLFGKIKSMSSATAFLDRVLDPVGHALSAESARQLVSLRADADVQRRIDDLADRANEGTLTPEEKSEYESLIAAATVVSLLQAKARKCLAGPSAA
jgi:hypothetical protein